MPVQIPSRQALTVVAALAVTVLVTVGVAADLWAATITVDVNGSGDYTTIAPALFEAASGDTVIVFAGVYTGPQNKNLDFDGEDILLIGASGAAETVIDGEGSGRAFTFGSGESPAATVQGFTIVDAPTGSPVRIVGGSSPTFRSCVIKNNHVTTNSGGGIFCLDSAPTFIDCAIVENSTVLHGGGVFVAGASADSTVSFVDCCVVGNRADGRGGGLSIGSGAVVSITNSTIAANEANLSAGGFDGGGLLIAGAMTTVTLTRSILWGNRGLLGDDAYVTVDANLAFNCCDVDTTGVAGGGSVDFGPLNISREPHFCRPSYGRDAPWTIGDYALAENSPCLPANNPCGELIGAGGIGCGPVIVWTGDAGTTDWSNPLNWSTQTLPGPGDHVQITRGEVNLATMVQIGLLTQCFESSADTGAFTIGIGGRLGYGFGLGGGQKTGWGPDEEQLWREEVETQTVKVVYDEGSDGITAESEGGPFGWLWPLHVVEEGVCEFRGGDMTGSGVIVNDGRLRFELSEPSIVEFEVENLGASINGQLQEPGIFVQSGTLVVNELVTNVTQFTVGVQATVQLDTGLRNVQVFGLRDPRRNESRETTGGLVTVAGDLTGSGVLDNLAAVEKIGPGVSQISLAIENRRGFGPDAVGTVRILEGTWAANNVFRNDGELHIDGPATLELAAPLANLAAGVVSQIGNVAGTGSIENTGFWLKDMASASSVDNPFANRFDTATGERGLLRVNGGQLTLRQLENSGFAGPAAGNTLTVTDSLCNNHGGIIGGRGTIAVQGAVVEDSGNLSPGFSSGILHYVGDWAPTTDSALRIEIGGPFPGEGYDRLVVDGTVTYGGALHVSLVNDFVPSVGDTFAVVTVATDAMNGGGAPRSDFDCISGIQNEGLPYLAPIALPDRYLLVASAAPPNNTPPTAYDDSVVTDGSSPLRLTPLRNDSDNDGDGLRLVSLSTAATRGVAFLDVGDTTITYLPPEGYVGSDTLGYTITDCQGANDAARIVIGIDMVSGMPGVATLPLTNRLHPGYPNPFNPVTRIRFDLRQPGEIQLAVYDLRGRKVCSLASGFYEVGTFVRNWRGNDDAGRRLPSGIYFVRLAAGSFVATQKLVLLK